MQVSEGAAGDEQCARDYFMIPGGSTDGNAPTKDRYCGAKLTAIDYNGNNGNRILGQQVVTKTNGPIVLRFRSDDVLLTKVRSGFRIKFEQSSENCLVTNPNVNANPMMITGYSSASSALPLNGDRLNGISLPPSMSLKSEKNLDNLSRLSGKRINI